MRTLCLLTLSTILPLSSAFAEAKPACEAPKSHAKVKPDKALRQSAQRGLDYLARASVAWTNQHKCYGCHVQAVTLEGLTVGHHNQYTVATEHVDAMAKALRLGVTAGGRRTGAAFQGAAWARYDEWIGPDQTGQLLKYAHELLEYQNEAGAVEDDDRRPPIVAGTMQTTFQAMQTWRQAYARTADEAWLGPMRKAEAYLAKTSSQWRQMQQVSILDLNYALLGLMAAGVGPNEPPAARLTRALLARQRKDGGFALDNKRSDALASGQTLYALKRAGMQDRDPAIARGLRWLVRHQGDDGGWHTVRSGQRGADKGEAMWAVLGLVSVDVMSLDVAGLSNGQRVGGPSALKVHATDNQGTGITSLQVLVDDLAVASACGADLKHTLKVDGLSEGKHVIDFVATNAEGKTARRRLEFHTGDIYITHLGTRFNEAKQATEVSLRSLSAPPPASGLMRLDVLTVGPKPRPVHSQQVAAEPGAMTLTWLGEQKGKAKHGKGRYLARVSYLNPKGQILQQREVVFFHDTTKAQRQTYGEVEGQVRMSKNARSSAHTVVELVDKAGRVLQRTRTTGQGNYRFKNVDSGKYWVRVKKKGFQEAESEVETSAMSAPASADLNLH